MNSTTESMAAEIEVIKNIFSLNGIGANLDMQPVPYSEAKKETYIKEHEADWKSTGEFYRKWRLEHFYSKAEVARTIGVSDSTLTRFEKGLPTTRASVIECGYKMLINLDNLHRMFGMYEGKIADVNSFANAVISQINNLCNEPDIDELRENYIYANLAKIRRVILDAELKRIQSAPPDKRHQLYNSLFGITNGGIKI